MAKRFHSDPPTVGEQVKYMDDHVLRATGREIINLLPNKFLVKFHCCFNENPPTNENNRTGTGTALVLDFMCVSRQPWLYLQLIIDMCLSLPLHHVTRYKVHKIANYRQDIAISDSSLPPLPPPCFSCGRASFNLKLPFRVSICAWSNFSSSNEKYEEQYVVKVSLGGSCESVRMQENAGAMFQHPHLF